MMVDVSTPAVWISRSHRVAIAVADSAFPKEIAAGPFDDCNQVNQDPRSSLQSILVELCSFTMWEPILWHPVVMLLGLDDFIIDAYDDLKRAFTRCSRLGGAME